MKNLVLALMLVGTQVLAEGKVIPINEVFEHKQTFDPNKFGKVAVVQWNPTAPTPLEVTEAVAEAYKQSNREVIADYVREAAQNGAKLIVTPEFSIVGYPDIPELPPEEDEFRSPEDIKPYVETVSGKSTQYFAKLAKELGVYIHIGFAEKESKGDKYYNVIVVVNPEGKFETKFRKINLFEGENNFLFPGTKPVIYDNSFFGKIGIAVCADIYSSNPMDQYSEKEVTAVALSTSWARYNTGMTAFVAAAKNNNTYVLAANQTYFPDSGVINPNGTKQSHIRQTTGIAYGYLPLK